MRPLQPYSFLGGGSMEEIGIVKALRESIELLRTENSRQRRLIGRLRKTCSDLRRLKNIQIENDEAFREMCTGDVLDIL
jgi:hypothetical protein